MSTVVSADGRDVNDDRVVITVDENEAEILLKTLDKDHICEALALLKLAQQFGFTPEEVANALTTRQKNRQRSREFYVAHKVQKKTQRVAQGHAETEDKKEEKQGQPAEKAT